MIDFETWKKAWALLDRRERRQGYLVLAIIVVTGLLSAVMVGSVLPFLTLVANPDAIETMPTVAAAFDWFSFQSRYSFLLATGAVSLAIIILTSLAQIARTYAISMFTGMRIHSLSHRLFANYLRQPYEFFFDRHSGNLGTQILSECQQVVDQFFRPAAEIIAAAVSGAAVLALVFWLSPDLAAICILVLGGVYGATYFLAKRRIAALAEERFVANQSRYRIAVEALGGLKAIKILGRETSYIERFEAPSRTVARAQAFTAVMSEIPNYVLQALAFGGIIALALFLLPHDEPGMENAMREILPMIGLFAFAGQRLLPEIQRIYAGFTQMQQGHLAVNAVYSDMQLVAASDADIAPGDALRLRCDLVLDDVTYHYPGANQPGLQGVSLTLRAGEVVGVVGTTGAGKSTLADLLLGLVSPRSGALRVDGVTIDADNVRAWQTSLGYVPQDIFLVDASISENVALGCKPEDIDSAKVAEACRIAKLQSFIENELPNGYATMIGERGVRLSGGQRQRVGIARALYNDADLLIFDEATSALDNVTEDEVMGAIEQIPGEKTMVIIAHRLTTLRNCDRIAVLENGKLDAIGTWKELTAQNAIFRKLAGIL